MPIEVKNLTKIYQSGSVKTTALKNVNLTIPDGDFVVILGPSGSGKTTLLNTLSGLDDVTSGTIEINGVYINGMSQDQLTEFRRRHLGFAFQQFNLLQNLTVEENVRLGSDLTEKPMPIQEILDAVGLLPHRKKFPSELSGGEQQRVSLARSIAKNPPIIFCDEPTGSLDEENSRIILDILERMNRDRKMTTLVITHNVNIADMADMVIRMNSGQITEITRNQVKKTAFEIKWA